MTDPVLILGAAVALAMDAFAVAVGISIKLGKPAWSQILRLSFFFGLFQFGMPVLGWSVGSGLGDNFRAFDHWGAFGLLCLIGGRMIYGSFLKGEPGRGLERDPTTGLTLLGLSLATSLDALAVGLSLAVLQKPVFTAAVIIGNVTFVLTGFGAWLGVWLGRAVGKRAELAGGVILVLIGVKILFEHLS